ncbi:hypothetical protein QA641_39930 [Bradyrhizobium sp. CB1650]|uniref:hypothetical protein n=1 Tax=Bradyrhizobium sp. CB1650 TaxID=3039153 RepID=UPI002435B047|nr:hypothetical protein [Bradyrhizobium sp. CB1650]WGD56910.1 hypothetical protein QA641_39930 [Bradyrhizobium sp. CB1650]
MMDELRTTLVARFNNYFWVRRLFDDARWEAKDGRYRVRIDSEWVDDRNDAVLDGPN